MGCCALGTCTDPACRICVELPQRFPPIAGCPVVLEDAKGHRVKCRFITGHRGRCVAGPWRKRTEESVDSWWRGDLPRDG